MMLPWWLLLFFSVVLANRSSIFIFLFIIGMCFLLKCKTEGTQNHRKLFLQMNQLCPVLIFFGFAPLLKYFLSFFYNCSGFLTSSGHNSPFMEKMVLLTHRHKWMFHKVIYYYTREYFLETICIKNTIEFFFWHKRKWSTSYKNVLGLTKVRFIQILHFLITTTWEEKQINCWSRKKILKFSIWDTSN